MKLLFLIGDAAVGKMTVGQELVKRTELRLFHNHMTIEPVLEVFGEFNGRVIHRLREVFFEEFAASDKCGMIFTVMWAFDMESDWAYIRHVQDIFLSRNPETEFYFAELVAPQEIRLQRNGTENRLRCKASKRDLEASNRRLLRDDANHRLESRDGELPFAHYIKLDTSHMEAAEAAERIRAAFAL